MWSQKSYNFAQTLGYNNDLSQYQIMRQLDSSRIDEPTLKTISALYNAIFTMHIMVGGKGNFLEMGESYFLIFYNGKFAIPILGNKEMGAILDNGN